ncbi:MAG: hypothetical protein JJ713_05640 [Acidithiobacillus sp.]|uniref:hypothetical protein n=1 Tax=Acidithiobacillus sp. TaxID=1872118 RepID=UPI00258D4F19|nr:hypothetical protein [Acidithiobacillus sp.]MCE5420251.1 hypothetical protein [Acidithiobacillus sp.]
MTYQTGTASNPTQLLDALRTFALANGWAQDRWEWDVESENDNYTLSLSKNGIHVHLCTAQNEKYSFYENSSVTGLFLTASTAFDDSEPWWNQPGAIPNRYYANGSGRERTAACGLYQVSTANTYHLLAASSPDFIALVVEVSPGIYHHLAFGAIATYGSTAGGEFVSGSFGLKDDTESYRQDYLFGINNDYGGLPFMDYKINGMSYVRAVVDGVGSWFSLCRSSPRSGKRCLSLWGEVGAKTDSNNNLGNRWWTCAPNGLNGLTPMLPFYLLVERDNGFFSPIGYCPHLRYLNIRNYAPTQQFALGQEQWMVFPAHSRNQKSGEHGFAVRVNG